MEEAGGFYFFNTEVWKAYVAAPENLGKNGRETEGGRKADRSEVGHDENDFSLSSAPGAP